MAQTQSCEGVVPLELAGAGKPCETWYKIVGDLETSKRRTPLITLHGGPSACHELLRPLADLHRLYGIPVIFYDQIGNGRSTHLREKAGDRSFWNEDLFIKELDNLVDHLGLRGGFDLFGHSWGGQLGLRYATRHPKGLRKLVIAECPASVELILKEREKQISNLPEDVQKTLSRCEQNGTTDSEEYKEAAKVWSKRHLCRLDPWPEEMDIGLAHVTDDPTVSGVMWGPVPLVPDGVLKDWTIIPDAHTIEAECFIIHGRYDQVTDATVIPLFERIPKVRWVTLENSSHLGFYEERQRYMELLGIFLVGSGGVGLISS